MTLSQCPYDGTAIEIEHLSGGSLLLACPACGKVPRRQDAPGPTRAGQTGQFVLLVSGTLVAHPPRQFNVAETT